jgi:hypothetical protein
MKSHLADMMKPSPSIILSVLALLFGNLLSAQSLNVDPDLLSLPNESQQSWQQEIDKNAELNPQLIAWIELKDGSKSKNWALLLNLDESDTTKDKITMGTLYTSSGRSFEFESMKCKLDTWLYGPIKDRKPEKSKVKQHSVWVNKDYLLLGMHQVHDFFEAGRKYREIAGIEERLNYSISSEPIDDESLLLAPEVVEGMGLTETAERSFVGVIPSLGEFFGIIYETDGLKDILLELIPKKAFIGMLNPFANRGIGIQIANTDAINEGKCEILNEQGEDICTLPVLITVNGNPAIEATLYAIAPEGPWKTSAGIIAVHAQSVAHEDRSVLIRVQPY